MMWPVDMLFSKFHQILMQFVEYFSLSDCKLNSLSPIGKLHEALAPNQIRNPLQTSPFVFTSYQHNTSTSNQTRKSIQSSPFVFTPYPNSVSYTNEQCELQTTPLNNVNSWEPHWTLWILDIITPLNNVNSWEPTEQCEFLRTPLNNVNSW